MDREIKIILADDHEIVRVGLKRLLNINKNIKILAEASNGVEAITLIDYYKPDIALIDILMPKLDGIQATRQIKEKNPDILCIILTAFEDSGHIEKALRAGADGYLSKDINSKDLIDAIVRVFRGERVFSKSILSIIKKYPSNESHNISEDSVSISKREQQIINMVSAGMTSSEIAAELQISVRTVQTHRANIMKKLNVKNVAELVKYSLENL